MTTPDADPEAGGMDIYDQPSLVVATGDQRL